MHVVIFHNAVSPEDSAADRDVLVQAEAVAEALRALGHTWEMLPCTLDMNAARTRLTELRPDVVFQLVESLLGADQLAYLATGLLDVLGVSYTGSPTEALLLTNHKLLAKERLGFAGLPTPEWIAQASARMRTLRPASTASHGRPLAEREAYVPAGQYVIKAVGEHASFGLDEHSLVSATDEADLRAHLERQSAAMGKPCFAERFIDGREFNLSLLAGPAGPEVLPPAEIDFSAFPAGKPRIVGVRAKWEEGTFEFQNTPRRFEFPETDRPLLRQLSDLAWQCWGLFGLGGYVRVDFRVDGEGRPWILEINTNPCLSPDAGYAATLRQAGISFPVAVQRVLADAIDRAPSNQLAKGAGT